MKMILLVLNIFAFHIHAQEITPTEEVTQTLSFADDMQFENIDLAIERQLKAYDRLGLKGTIRFGNKVYPKTVLRDSLLLFKDLAGKARACLKVREEKACIDELNAHLNSRFAIYRPVPGEDEAGYRTKQTKFTSYYSPDFNGSRAPTARFTRPIYRTPELTQDKERSRVEIDYHGALAGKGLEIFWVEESFYDIYLLHVQGGGRINVHNPDGSIEKKYLSFDSKNNRSFQMIHKYMVQQGYITNGSIPNQRRYLEEHPEKAEEIFGVCPSYVFFKESDEEPVGVHSIPLTEGRSVAIDTRIYKSVGMINFIKTVKQKKPFSRFFIAQDTGGAIRGNARCDLYMGYGPQAEAVAYSMNDLGEQYFLIKK